MCFNEAYTKPKSFSYLSMQDRSGNVLSLVKCLGSISQKVASLRLIVSVIVSVIAKLLIG